MQRANTSHSLQQGGGVPQCLRSRTRTRRRRRKRAWGAAWAYLLPVFLNRGTVWSNPVLIWVATPFPRKYGRPAEHLCLMTCGHCRG